MPIAPSYHAPLSIAVHQHYQKLIDALNRIPVEIHAQRTIQGSMGLVSPADIIAYHIGWATLLISWYQASLRGAMPEMPGAGFTTWDYRALAENFYTAYHYDGGKLQQAEFKRLVVCIITIIEQ